VAEPACAARIGGDEFMVLMPGTERAGAERLKDHIDSMLELNNQFYPGQPLSLAVGIATCHHAHELEQACQEADRAMYAAKAHYYATHQIERRRPGSV
jgi:diguanylate cyclase (GGDEF)-like protein